MMNVERAAGAAQRRRGRRLRAALRHERQSIAMALAEMSHHTAPRGLRMARAGEEGREEHDALRRQRPPPPQPELFQLYEEEPGGRRPTGLVEPPGPQERVPRHTVEQMADVAPMVQILDAPVPQMVEHVVDVLKTFDRGLAEQVIEVPKVTLQDVVPQRAVLRVPQLAEQLVDMPVPESVILAHGRWVDISAASQRHVRTVQIVQKTGESPGAVLGSVGTRPLLCNDRLYGADSAETVEVPQMQYSDWVVGVLAVAVHRQGWTSL